jgi:thiol-disulfide isomerase/thioredoxin
LIGMARVQVGLKILLLSALIADAAALQSCDRRSQEQDRNTAPARPQVTDVQWTDEAARRTASSGKLYALPQLRVYDTRGQLVYNLPMGANAATIGPDIEKALKSDRTVLGPTLKQSLADLRTYQDRPASSVVGGQIRPVIFDYWAAWCIPCKALERALLGWAGHKPPGSVQIVKAETDIMKAERASRQRTFFVKTDASGKQHSVESK